MNQVYFSAFHSKNESGSNCQAHTHTHTHASWYNNQQEKNSFQEYKKKIENWKIQKTYEMQTPLHDDDTCVLIIIIISGSIH